MTNPGPEVRVGRRAAAVTASFAAVLLATATAGCDSTPYPTGDEFTTTVQGAEPSVPGTSYPPSYPADPSPVVVDVDIANGSVQPQNATLSATVGQPIELRVDSDAAANIEIEGALNRTFAVKPVADQVFDFTVDDPGSVTITTRQPAQTIATVEVAPRPPQ
ncbi:hypothetical protein [Mycobacterium sp. IDR2000157661]|uniref:hypothetical protein n=1 Tax=Mycobacterium sp. IDR2000157661 TaxID=2867005 RepID=UPI001EEA4BD9|nr:hypothetical protein [Mycobacterium sp. IDR2000157661]ULE31614.1 hypothetical protein K3G64_15525 [Mycobacterium sp. IDR2000157661]